ncbi:MAG: hypothetical protein OEY56_08385, partial [Cyclobacteriaceae bacterium]|nr:hypothetical protein [Cyclobacteriaceae bacterium]
RLSLSAAKSADGETSARYTVEVDVHFGQDMLQQVLALSLPDDMDWNACELDQNWIHGVSAVFGSTHPMAHASATMPTAGREYAHKLLFDVTHAVKNRKAGADGFNLYLIPLNTENGLDFYLTGITLYEHLP